MCLTIDAHQHFWQLGRQPFDYTWLERRKWPPFVVTTYRRI